MTWQWNWLQKTHARNSFLHFTIFHPIADSYKWCFHCYLRSFDVFADLDHWRVCLVQNWAGWPWFSRNTIWKFLIISLLLYSFNVSILGSCTDGSSQFWWRRSCKLWLQWKVDYKPGSQWSLLLKHDQPFYHMEKQSKFWFFLNTSCHENFVYKKKIATTRKIIPFIFRWYYS